MGLRVTNSRLSKARALGWLLWGIEWLVQRHCCFWGGVNVAGATARGVVLRTVAPCLNWHETSLFWIRYSGTMTISLLVIFAIGLIGVSGSTLIALGFINAACIAR